MTVKDTTPPVVTSVSGNLNAEATSSAGAAGNTTTGTFKVTVVKL